MKAEDILNKNNCSRATVFYDKYDNQLDGDCIIEWMEDYHQLRLKEIMPTDEIIKIAAEIHEQKASLGYSAKGYVSDDFIAGVQWLKSEIEKHNT